MKRRMANKIENYKILPKRLINKYMSLSFEQGYFSVSIEFKGCVKVYVRDVWGRILRKFKIEVQSVVRYRP